MWYVEIYVPHTVYLGCKMKHTLHVGCLVKMKSYPELVKLGIRGPESDIPFMNDVGVVIQVTESHVRVLWQKLGRDADHYSYILDKIAD